VKAAKPKPAPAPMPELPSPVSRQVLASFAEDVVHLALEAAKKHKKPGASISADKVLELARKHELVDKDHAFSRAMLLVLGKLRDPSPDLRSPAQRGKGKKEDRAD
jgi:hypothetical protein